MIKRNDQIDNGDPMNMIHSVSEDAHASCRHIFEFILQFHRNEYVGFDINQLKSMVLELIQN